MKLIKDGIAKTIPTHLAAEYKVQGWQEILPDVPEAETEAENATEADAPEAEKPKRGRSKKEA